MNTQREIKEASLLEKEWSKVRDHQEAMWQQLLKKNSKEKRNENA